MKLLNFKDKIALYTQTKPSISNEEIGLLLLIDTLYKDLPEDLDEFRSLFTHLDPSIIDQQAEGIMFLKIVNANHPPAAIKQKLNRYINIKYNFLGDSVPYQKNMERFCKHSAIITEFLDDILRIAKVPDEVADVLREDTHIRSCVDFYNLLINYRKTSSRRTKFEILRKIGLIVLLSRIEKTFIPTDIDNQLDQIMTVFMLGLGARKGKAGNFFHWIDQFGALRYSPEREKARKEYQRSVATRKKHALRTYPMQIFHYQPLTTGSGKEILHLQIRNKLRKNGYLSYSSLLEKIIRKNAEFPNQIRDIIGVKLIVENESMIPQIIHELEGFLGGTSTRKKEKNTLDKFGKRKLGRYSSKNYYVWKAIYDITLPHPSILHVKQMMKLTKGNRKAQEALRDRLEYFKDRPQDAVVEVQLQDLNSHLLSNARGSATDHDFLKMNQVRSNSFFKLFPKEIYREELQSLRTKILSS